MIKEFKEFALKGNVMDLAIGVIIGGAFGKIVTSLVNDIIMPIIGVLLGGVNFTSLKYTIRPENDGLAALTLNYGMFIQTVIDFLIISLSIFLFIKFISKFKRKEEVEEKLAVTEISKEEALLTEIRDILKEK
ncbi:MULTISPECIES: large-conductance mechanosensitive channel protein MscL [unclassified Clostridium]|uniref:large-conductance mechanosensitive channel protein MscL n=1 Tax=unclassified Clostridium TaxID=2614128 RepID=UPI000EE788D3|nr:MULTISPECIES: large-conductance mechanosensitive channel protein MscL [unclassified Clostridium]HCQ90836.1 large conductance mechanosensitive channel protein MscL [Clostridium sp.]